MKSSDVKLQMDYIITMDLINRMLDKVTPIPTPGSIIIGKQYAKQYSDKITQMLSDEYIDKQILLDMSHTVKKDLDFIIQDGNRRFFTYHIQENRNMMSMILDFVLTLK